jgi:rubrerythrin
MRLIDADAFLKSEIERCGCVPLIGSCTSDNEIFKFILERQPTIDAKEVVHGKWIKLEGDCRSSNTNEPLTVHECSICGAFFRNAPYNFCPKCGADMRGKKA